MAHPHGSRNRKDCPVKSNISSALLLTAVAAAILPPGYLAYIGSYIALIACLLSFVLFMSHERDALAHPTSLAILAAIALVAFSVPFVYQSPQDLLAPVLLLPMLCSIALGLLARPARYVPGTTAFAAICLAAAALALAGGAFESFVLGALRPGLGNNPIHYASLAVMAGGLSVVGVLSVQSSWRHLFLLGPIFGLGSALVADSRGPMLGAAAVATVGYFALLVWLWNDVTLRRIILTTLLLTSVASAFLINVGNSRIASILNSAFNIFRFTGGSDDIRTMLYSSAIQILRRSPIVGVGLGQIMQTAQELFPHRPEPTWLENLHADWANFAAMAGSIGLLAWLLLLAAPTLLLVNKTCRQDRPVVLGVIVMTTGQLVLGISNATFGILPQTTIYAVALGYFLVRARRLTQ